MALKFEPELTEAELLNGQKIANDHLPKGRLWEAFGVPETANYAISAAVGAMIALHLKYIEYLQKELNPYTTVDLISEWEASCGLPDPCTIHFGNTLEQRRKQVIYRLRRKPTITANDFEKIIKEMTGFLVKVVPRSSSKNILANKLDGAASLDLAELSTDKRDRFIFDVFVDYTDLTSLDNGGELDSAEMDGKSRPNIIECLVNQFKSASSMPIYHYDKNLYNRMKK